jgi:cerato-platanin
MPLQFPYYCPRKDVASPSHDLQVGARDDKRVQTVVSAAEIGGTPTANVSWPQPPFVFIACSKWRLRADCRLRMTDLQLLYFLCIKGHMFLLGIRHHHSTQLQPSDFQQPPLSSFHKHIKMICSPAFAFVAMFAQAALALPQASTPSASSYPSTGTTSYSSTSTPYSSTTGSTSHYTSSTSQYTSSTPYTTSSPYTSSQPTYTSSTPPSPPSKSSKSPEPPKSTPPSSPQTLRATFDQTYDNKAGLMNNVACSNGANGLAARFPTFGNVPSFPFIGGAFDVVWNSPNCGSCWKLTNPSTGASINITAIDTAGTGFNIAQEAFVQLNGGQVGQGFVDVVATKVSTSVCGL